MSLTALAIAGIIGAIGSIGTGIASAVSNYKATQKANETNVDLFNQQNAFNAEQANIQRTWEENLANTAYQRSMVDMEAAGLNPLLAANIGGASVPSGSSAVAGSTSVNPNPIDLSGVASALQSLSTISLIGALKGDKFNYKSPFSNPKFRKL